TIARGFDYKTLHWADAPPLAAGAVPLVPKTAAGGPRGDTIAVSLPLVLAPSHLYLCHSAEGFMLEDAARAISQMLSPPLRAVLWKSIGLALALIVVVAIVLNRLISWLLGAGSVAVENGLGPHAHMPATVLGWVLSIAAGLGIVVGSVMLMPAVTA